LYACFQEYCFFHRPVKKCGLDILYPPYPSQLVVDVYQNVKHVFGVCIFCPHFDILWFDIILHSVHSCRGFYFPKLNMSWMQEDVKHCGYGHYVLYTVSRVDPLCVDIKWSDWLLFNANSAIFQLHHGGNKVIFNVMMMRYTL
jgi:hypothetical protein